MKRIFFLTAFCLTINLTRGQIAEIRYNLDIDVSGTAAKPIEQQFFLLNSNGLSLQKQFVTTAIGGFSKDKNEQNSRTVHIGNDTTFIFKNFNMDALYYEQRIHTRMFNVSDRLALFDWQILPDTLTLLGYKCQKATTKFRGRDYVAWFAPSIPIPDGPAKFNGLPGLILKVDISDPLVIYRIEAYSVKLTGETKNLKNPFDDRNITSFPDFKKIYNQKYAEMESFTKSDDPNTTVSIKRGGLEILSNE